MNPNRVHVIAYYQPCVLCYASRRVQRGVGSLLVLWVLCGLVGAHPGGGCRRECTCGLVGPWGDSATLRGAVSLGLDASLAGGPARVLWVEGGCVDSTSRVQQGLVRSRVPVSTRWVSNSPCSGGSFA